jgi:nicotinate-nucleotide adenylyltransferase
MAYQSPRPVPGRDDAALNGRDYRIPPFAPGMRVGLFGGTFDPPHEAHLAACLLAMRRLQLDRVWWLVTPGNPLKNTAGLAPLAERIAAARTLARHPRIDVTGFEAAVGVRYTYDTVKYLVTRCHGVRFVWIMGADNLRSFHRWNNWRGIASLVPIVVVDRLGPSLYASAGVAGRALAFARVREESAVRLPMLKPPAWAFLHGLKSPLSSTQLRARRRPTAAEIAASQRSEAASRGNGSGEIPAPETAPAGSDTAIVARPPESERNRRQGTGGG